MSRDFFRLTKDPLRDLSHFCRTRGKLRVDGVQAIAVDS
jgi:hypothetical protein